MQPIPAEMFNVKADRRAWVDRRCRPQALATFECPVLLTGEHAKVTDKTYLLADGWDPSPFRYFAQHGGHWPVVRDPAGSIALDWGVRGPPESYVVAPSGSCVAMVRHHYEEYFHGRPEYDALRKKTFELSPQRHAHKE